MDRIQYTNTQLIISLTLTGMKNKSHIKVLFVELKFAKKTFQSILAGMVFLDALTTCVFVNKNEVVLTALTIPLSKMGF